MVTLNFSLVCWCYPHPFFFFFLQVSKESSVEPIAQFGGFLFNNYQIYNPSAAQLTLN